MTQEERTAARATLRVALMNLVSTWDHLNDLEAILRCDVELEDISAHAGDLINATDALEMSYEQLDDILEELEQSEEDED